MPCVCKFRFRWPPSLGLCLIFGLAGCAAPQPDPGPGPLNMPVPQRLPLVFDADAKARWEPLLLPGKLRTAFSAADHDGRRSIRAHAEASASMLRQRLQVAPEQLGRLRFEWQVANLIEGADMTQREHEDAPVRLVLAFDGDRGLFSARDALLNELTRSLTGEEMPYAVLMYVWSNDQPVGTVIVNPRTERIRKIVVESGPARLQQWLQYTRDVRADFERAFGEPPQALQSVGIMTDTDNTRGRTQAWYGTIALEPAGATGPASAAPR
jgi:Protein of unknown function (DUF3047)